MRIADSRCAIHKKINSGAIYCKNPEFLLNPSSFIYGMKPIKPASFHLIKPYFIENRGMIATGVICLVLVDTIQLFIPRIYKRVVDDLTVYGIDIYGLLMYSLVILLIAGAMVLLRYGWWHCLIGVSRKIEEKLRNRLFDHIQSCDASYFSRTKTGDIMAHATNDIQHIRMASGMGMVALNDALFLGSAAVGFMAWINVKLTLFVLIPAPLIIISTKIITKRLHARYQDVQASFSDLTEFVRERFSGIRIIKAFNLEKESVSALNDVSERYIAKNLRLVRVVGGFLPLMIFFSNLYLSFVLYFGGRETILGGITPGEFVAFIGYLDLLTWPMMALGWVTNLMQRGKASLDRINVILETVPEIKDAPDASPLKAFDGRMTFDRVSFKYPGAGRKFNALSDIGLTLHKGKSLGITGPPGSGKSTLLSLIPRMFDPVDGDIRIDEQSIRNVRIEDLRAMISFMPQDPFLFAGTIRENLLLARPDAGSGEIDRVLEKAALDATIEVFPERLDTIVGEKGVILSGGQKQRISFARALLSDRPIMILDDPISQVDTQTGAKMIRSVMEMARKKTVVIVSHRISALTFADRIVVMDDGRIVESGDHAALMKKDGYYSKTHRMQSITVKDPAAEPPETN